MISEDDVKYVAGLARIHLGDNEINRLTMDLEKILDYINKLNALNVDEVQPTSHVLPLKNVYREDSLRPSLTQNETLKNSIAQLKGAFKVPKVIE